jgi:hypothetical protein
MVGLHECYIALSKKDEMKFLVAAGTIWKTGKAVKIMPLGNSDLPPVGPIAL